MVEPFMATFKAEFGALFGVRGISWAGLFRLFAVLAMLAIVLVVLLSPWKVLAVMLGAILVGFAYARPTWVLAFLAVYIPFEPFLLKFVPDELYVYAKYFSEGLIYLLFLAVVLRRFIERTRRPSTPLDLPLVLFFLATVASAVANFLPVSTAVLGIRQIVRFVVLFLAVANLGPSRGFTRKLVALMFGVVAIESLIGVLQAATGGALDSFLLPSLRKVYDAVTLTAGVDQTWDPGARVFGTLGRYDQLGTFLCFFLLMAVAWLYELPRRDHRRRYLAGLLVLGCVALALTASRASWFGFIGGAVIISAFIKRDRRVLWALGIVAGVLAAYLAYSGLVVKYLVASPSQPLVERVFEVFSYERYRGEYYGLGRVYWFVQTPLAVVLHAPVFGWGPGTYGGGAAAALHNTHVYDALGLPYGVYGTEGYIDNNWFSLWGEIGTLGLALYVWAWVALWRVARTVRRSSDVLMRGIGLAYAGIIPALAFQALLGTYLEVRTIALYFWLFAGLLVVQLRREKIKP